jgi:NADH-quinone oxidoreductase subunit A
MPDLPNPLTPPSIDPVGTLVFFLLAFIVVGAIFLFMHLVMGSFLRPRLPEPEKLTIYECGEPTVGSAWVQFDLRYYVVALLFVVFDVEVAFFFPWAVVFGTANQLSNPNLPAETRKQLTERLAPAGVSDKFKRQHGLVEPLDLNKIAQQQAEAKKAATTSASRPLGKNTDTSDVIPITAAAASGWARLAFWDLMVFFGVLLVGFAYLWRRGDIDWIRSVTHRGGENPVPAQSTPTAGERVVA